MSFSVDTIDLSLASPETGEYLTANVYYVDGVTDGLGGLRPLSIGQLVMAICLQRASDLEAQIVEMMEVMNTTSAQLKDMTDIEQAVIDYFSNNPSSHAYSVNNVPVTTATSAQALLQSLDIFNSSQEYVRDNASDVNNYMLYDEFITKIESKMDDMNSFSQQKMIELQSLTNKRDQSYDMISNILKSLNTVMTGIVNNTCFHFARVRPRARASITKITLPLPGQVAGMARKQKAPESTTAQPGTGNLPPFRVQGATTESRL